MSSRSIDFFDASKLLFKIFSSASPINTYHLCTNSFHTVMGGGVEGAGSLGVYSSRGCVDSRHSLHFLRGRDLFDHLEIDYLEVVQ